MTRSHLDRQVARRTGEAPRTIRALGFGPLRPAAAAALEPEDLELALDCPFCGRRATPAAAGPAAAERLAECRRCDAEFPFTDDDLYAVASLATLADRAWRRSPPAAAPRPPPDAAAPSADRARSPRPGTAPGATPTDPSPAPCPMHHPRR